MKTSKEILTDKEMEFVSLLMQDCQNTGDVQSKLKRSFAGAIEQTEAEIEKLRHMRLLTSKTTRKHRSMSNL